MPNLNIAYSRNGYFEQDEEFVSKVNIDRIIKQQLYKQHGLNVVYNETQNFEFLVLRDGQTILFRIEIND